MWSILDIEPKADIFFFDSFGIDGLTNFFIQNDRKVIEKILFGTEQITRANNKITLANIKFNLNSCKNLIKKLETLLNELFVLDDQDTNEATIQQYANENNILLHWLADLLLPLNVSIVRK